MLLSLEESYRVVSCALETYLSKHGDCFTENIEKMLLPYGINIASVMQTGKNLKDEIESYVKDSGVIYAQLEQINKNADSYFCSDIFGLLRRHYLIAEGVGMRLPTHIWGICQTLFYLFNSNYYFKNDKDVFDRIFTLAVIYWRKGFVASYVADKTNDSDYRDMIKVRHALEKLGVKAKRVEMGLVDVGYETYVKIQRSIENKIEKIGGCLFLKYLKQEFLLPKYNGLIGMYLITRNKRSTYITLSRETIVPVNFLIQLGLKHIDAVGRIKKAKANYKEVIRLSQAYVHILQIDSNNPFDDVLISPDYLGRYLKREMFFEKMVIPEQYNINYALKMLGVLLKPFQNEISQFGYTLRQYIRLASYILRKPAGELLLKEMIYGSRLPGQIVQNILNDISLNSGDVNKEFKCFIDSTTSRDYPLIKITHGRYYFFDNVIGCIGFYRALYNKLRKVKSVAEILNTKLGQSMEGYTRSLLERYTSCNSGFYQTGRKGGKEECDAIIDRPDNIIAFEIKYHRIGLAFENGNDIELWYDLAAGMLKAQKQNLRHRLDMMSHKSITLKDKTGKTLSSLSLFNKGKMKDFIPVSLCASNYRFLTSRPFTQMIMKNFSSLSFRTKDTSKQSRIGELLKIQKQMVQMEGEISFKPFNDQNGNTKKGEVLIDGKSCPAGKVIVDDFAYYKSEFFFDSIFLSLQQLWVGLKVTRTIDLFVEWLKHYIHVIDNSRDYYFGLLAFMKFRSSYS